MSVYRLREKRRQGIIPALRTRLFGERDAVVEQLRAIERRGAGMVRLAHACAVVMLVLFSLGSLVGIAGESATTFLAAWQHGQLDLIDGIVCAVSAALVLCMDVAGVLAALDLRILAARRAPSRTWWVHIGAIALADVLEAGCMAYMTWRYDPPAIAVVWVLVIGRDLAAPFYAVYLSLARTQPLGAREFLGIGETPAGMGLARDFLRVAGDPAAPIERKALVYLTAAQLAPEDRERVQGVIDVLADDSGSDGSEPEAGSAKSAVRSQRPAPALSMHTRAELRPRQRLHQQSQARQVSFRSRQDQKPDETDASVDGGAVPIAVRSGGGDARSNVRTPSHTHIADAAASLAHGDFPFRADTGMSQDLRLELRDLREEAARQILATVPTISVRDFARRIEAATGNPISEGTAQALLAKARAESWRSAGADSELPPTGSEA